MKINLYLAIILLGLLFIVLPSIIIMLFYNKKNQLRIIGIVFFIIYCVFLGTLVFGDVKIKNNEVIVALIKDENWFSMHFLLANFSKLNIAYNLVMLFPASAFVFAFCKSKFFLKTVLLSFIISVIIELFQFILPVSRTTELFDLVTNTISGIIGYIYYYLIILVAKKLNKKE